VRDRNTKTLDEIKREHILKVLDASGWDFNKASSILNVSVSYLKKELRSLKETKNLGKSKKTITKKQHGTD